MGLFDMVGSFASNISNAVIAKRQRRASELATDKQYSRDIEQRDYMNAYNSPKAQMERFGEAGLNPNLIYGKGTSGTQTAQVKSGRQETPYSNVDVNLGDPLGELNKYQNFRKLQKETDLTSEVVAGQKLDNALKEGTLSTNIQKALAQLENINQKNLSEQQKRELMSQMTGLKNIQMQIEQKKLDRYESGTENAPYIIRMLMENWLQLKDGMKKYSDGQNPETSIKLW